MTGKPQENAYSYYTNNIQQAFPLKRPRNQTPRPNGEAAPVTLHRVQSCDDRPALQRRDQTWLGPMGFWCFEGKQKEWKNDGRDSKSDIRIWQNQIHKPSLISPDISITCQCTSISILMMFLIDYRNLCEFWAPGQAGEMPLPQGQRGETHRSIYLCFLTRFVGGSVFQEGCVFGVAQPRSPENCPMDTRKIRKKSDEKWIHDVRFSGRIMKNPNSCGDFTGIFRRLPGAPKVTGAYEEVRDFNVCLGRRNLMESHWFWISSMRFLCLCTLW